jgi:hypothetical protein
LVLYLTQLIAASNGRFIKTLPMFFLIYLSIAFIWHAQRRGTFIAVNLDKKTLDAVAAFFLPRIGLEQAARAIFSNQKKLGVIPQNAQLTAWPNDLPQWDTLSAEAKKLYIRQADGRFRRGSSSRASMRVRTMAGCFRWSIRC